MKFNKPYKGYGSYQSAVNGIANYIQNYERFRISGNPNMFFNKLSDLMILYLSEKKLKFRNNKKISSMYFNANMIQENFKNFKQWLDDNDKLTFKESINDK